MLAVKIHNLNHKINNTSILKNINFELKKETIACVLGPSGSGKRVLVNNFVKQIYSDKIDELHDSVMDVNCAHGKGIKFIRDELKFFAKTNIQGTKGIQFKTIVLFNADSLTIDAQSAMRRCIEQFSHNTRFFIVVENKHKMLNPILSRFCEIYIPDNIDKNGKLQNLHQYHLEQVYGKDKQYINWFNEHLGSDFNKQEEEWIQLANTIYENGYSTIDFINWIKQHTFFTQLQISEVVMYFHKIKSEYRSEKLLLFTIFIFLKNII